MATVNFIRYKSQSKTALCKVTQYVEREDKTMEDGERQLVSGQNCTPRSAYREFLATREMNHKESPVWFYHYTQSFSPKEDITPRQAHELAKEFAARAWPDSEVLISTHLDAAHIHSHFIVNAVCHETGKMLRQGPETLKYLRKISDELCTKHGYSVLSFPQKHNEGMSAREYRSAAKGESKKLQLMNVINDCMRRSESREQFIAQMESRGYKVRWEQNRKNITYTTPDGWQCRDRKLFGEKYLKEMMELEFAARTKIIYGRTYGEEPTRADNTIIPRTDFAFTVGRNPMRTAGVGRTAGETGADLFRTESVSETPVGGAQFVSDPSADGRSAEVDTAHGSNGRTGWEEERKAFLASQIQTTQRMDLAPGMGLDHGDHSSMGIGRIVSDLTALGRHLESSQSNAPVIDSTTRRFRGDSKQLRKEQEKKIALGHKEDDHEDDINYSMRLTM